MTREERRQELTALLETSGGVHGVIRAYMERHLPPGQMPTVGMLGMNISQMIEAILEKEFPPLTNPRPPLNRP